jgi:hypothetical protein
MALFALKKEAVLYYMSHFTARGKKMIFFLGVTPHQNQSY